ncbi:MAG: ATP-binding protein [Deltaproteobacteria bacterium]|nr:ATP-binding protein [Deltaproteobacteria bacterium]
MELLRARLPWILAILVAVFIGLLALRTHRAVADLDASQRERAILLADTLAATVQGIARYGPETRERVESVFDAVCESSRIRGIALLDEDRNAVLVGGEPSVHWIERARKTGLQEAREDGAIAVVRPVDLKVGHGYGHGSGRREGSLEAGSYALLLVTDDSPAEGVRAHILASDLALLVVGLALAGLGWLLVLSQARNHALRQRMALQEQRRAGLESLRLLAAGLAHETRNPMGAIRGYTQLLHEEASSAEVRARTELMLEQIDRITSRLDEFLSFARRRQPARETVDLTALARSVVELMALDAKSAGVTLEVAADGNTAVEGDRRQLQEALLNLVLNAVQACRPGDRVRVRVEPDARGATLAVEDTGAGIAPEDLPRVTQPYVSLREGGTGLGLAIVEGVAEAHHTVLTIASRPGEGSRFSMHLARELPRDA